ncbi:MAG: hypothetical protein LBQ02_02945 [Candidatus Nomurabacteria bacterium]|jgi:uncharacterized protein (TIGR02145 family)|nr:hypothetical protein [Candidatus Nomurabacteria bacterium]
MLTNLAYAGGGTDTYGDVKSITYWDRSSAFFGGSLVNAYTLPYFTDTGSGKDSAVSYTIEPTSPSLTSGSGGQYGYLYNWCAAMGGQSGACTDLNTAPKGYDATVSICPANWRLPTGGTNREFVALNKAVNSGSKNSDAGLRSRWRGVYSGRYYNGSIYKNSYAHYWSSNAYTTHGASSVFSLFIDVRSSEPENFGNRYDGFAMRCIR